MREFSKLKLGGTVNAFLTKIQLRNAKKEDNESFASKIVSFFYLTGDYNGTQWTISGTVCI